METANFIVASAGPDLPGLQVIEFDPQRCELRNGSFRPANGLPVYVVSNQGKAFVCLKSGDIAGYSDGIMVFEQSRDPQLITEFRAPGHYYVHLAVHPNGKLIAAADYHGGKVSLFSFDDDGLKLTSSIHHEGSGPNVERQQSAHPHWVGFTPDLRFLLAADLGADLVRVYDYQNGELTELPERNIRITAGAGPRHAIFSADGRMFYLVNELENSVMVFEYHAGEFTLRQTLPTLPPDTTDWSLAAAIRISDSGRSLLVTNRFVDGIFYCGIDQETGLLNHIATVACGRYPGDLVVFDNQQVLVAARDDDRVELYLLDEVAQTLQPTQTAIEIPQPKSIGPNFHAEIVMALKPEASSLTITRANDSDFESLAITSTE
ncbi:MAG: lactonase family protein, partial [Promicromonosporaceae bacterium]|nr:lactonase family protein [Promicromonosporaceae bacterium]